MINASTAATPSTDVRSAARTPAEPSAALFDRRHDVLEIGDGPGDEHEVVTVRRERPCDRLPRSRRTLQ